MAHSDSSTAAIIPAQAPQNRQFYPALDGLRACAVLMVFVQHYLLSSLPHLWQWGWAGVDVFFVLSGFLITGILFDTRDSRHRFRNFYLRRTLRIFPLYYGVLLASLLVTPLIHWDWNITWVYWPFYAQNYVRFIFFNRFVQSGGLLESLNGQILHGLSHLRVYLGHFWSLAIEEQFYLAWPLVVFTVRDRVKLRNICIAVVVALPIIRLLVAPFVPLGFKNAEFFYRLTPFRVDALLMGGLLALIIRGPEGRRLRSIAPYLATLCAIVLIVMPIIGPIIAHHPLPPGPPAPWMETVGFSVIDLLSACIIWLSLQSGSLLFKLLSVRPLRRLGEISYGFYVFHDIPHLIYTALTRWLVGYGHRIYFGMVSVSLAFACTLALSALSFRYFERPFLRLKDRFAPS